MEIASSKKALVAVDFTEADEAVFKYVSQVSERLALEELTFAHVVPNLDFFRILAISNEGDLEAVLPQIDDVRVRLQHRVMPYFSNFKGKITYKVLEGNPLAEILKLSETETFELLFIGQRKGSDGHGILARKLVRKVKSHAMVVPQTANTSVLKLLVPVDFSENSARALREAIDFARKINENVEITALNVYEVPIFEIYQLGESTLKLNELVKTHALNALEDFLQKYAPSDNIKAVVSEMDLPSIGHYIVKYAVNEKIDLIGMGAKGHSMVELLLIGSVTEKVLSYNQQIPVLIIR
jgi:nucleotide-binding universal stress UspA family protein